MSHELRGTAQQPVAESIGSTDDKKPAVNELHTTTTVDTGDVIEASDYTAEQYRKIRWKVDRHLMLEACWALRAVSEEPLRSTAKHMLRTALPQYLELLTKIGHRWEAATTSANHPRPTVAGFATAFEASPNQVNSSHELALLPTNDDVALAQQLDQLLFADGPLIWNQHSSDNDTLWESFGVHENPGFPNFDGAFSDTTELFPWQPDRGLAVDEGSSGLPMLYDI